MLVAERPGEQGEQRTLGWPLAFIALALLALAPRSWYSGGNRIDVWRGPNPAGAHPVTVEPGTVALGPTVCATVTDHPDLFDPAGEPPDIVEPSDWPVPAPCDDSW